MTATAHTNAPASASCPRAHTLEHVDAEPTITDLVLDLDHAEWELAQARAEIARLKTRVESLELDRNVHASLEAHARAEHKRLAETCAAMTRALITMPGRSAPRYEADTIVIDVDAPQLAGRWGYAL